MMFRDSYCVKHWNLPEYLVFVSLTYVNDYGTPQAGRVKETSRMNNSNVLRDPSALEFARSAYHAHHTTPHHTGQAGRQAGALHPCVCGASLINCLRRQVRQKHAQK